MQEIAYSFEEKLAKIENWFKHKRRKEVHCGLLKFEVYIYFYEYNLIYIILISFIYILNAYFLCFYC